MNDEQQMPEPSDDAFLTACLATLKQLEPSLASRLQNRLAVANELHKQSGAAATKDLRWWRRSISIPIPIAAASIILLLGATIWSFVRPANSAPQSVATPAPLKAANSLLAEPAVAYFETGTYLCGIGRLKSDYGYFIQEQKQ
jgi:hypothetical protein